MTRADPIPLNENNNPGQARWCTDEVAIGRLECTKHSKRDGRQCHAPAIRGLDSCRMHAGHKAKVAKAKGEAKITAWQAIGSATGTIEPGMAVLGVLQMSWLRLSAYSQLLREQVEAQPALSGSADEDLPDSSGLIGHRYGMGGKEGITYVQTEEVRALVVLEAQERDRVVKYAKTAHDMGISRRLTELAEKWGDVVAGRITIMLAALALSPEQEAMVPALIQAHLGSIDMETMGDDRKAIEAPK